MKFLKKFEFDFFHLGGELAFGFSLSRWCISAEFLVWHVSLQYYTDEQLANRERSRKFLKEFLEEVE